MRRLVTPLIVIAVAATIVAGAIAAAREAPPTTARRPGPAFTVQGRVAGLYPGVRKVLRARVVNRFDHPIRVTRVSARVRSARPSCPATSVRVRPWRGVRIVPAHATRRVRLAVRMTPTAPNGCQGVRFRLRYDGRAVRP